MERILLVEPNYNNKYPPIGLMKISTYYKSKGDYVQFHKGLLPRNVVQAFDRVYVTTLFTFDFGICVDAIRYYVEIVGIDKVYVGGIASTIMPKRFETAVPGIQLLIGQLTSSNMLGYSDNVNIDILELDYDMLWDIAYEYPASDSYFIYTSRGCPRKCSFCAVKTLEPIFYECENIREQILRVDEKYGKKRQLLIMDNNALNAENFERSIDTMVDLGFGQNNNTCKKANSMYYHILSLRTRLEVGRPYKCLLDRIKNTFEKLTMRRISSSDQKILMEYVKRMDDDDAFARYVIENSDYLIEFFARYNYHSIKRYVDYNQGLDARLLTDEKARQLARIALKPCRIAFDDIKSENVYFDALDRARMQGIRHFSNYLLYNYNDCPEELWQRLWLNVEYCEKHPDIATLFSFPMKYASIEHTDRSYVGRHWNGKYLRAINVILNVTSGVVAKEKNFFLRAFGESQEAFLEILTMPDDFIRYREYFEECGLAQKWAREYKKLSQSKKEELVKLLSNCSTETEVINENHSRSLDNILKFYSVKRSKVIKNYDYYMHMFS